MLSWGSQGSLPRAYRRCSSAHVSGMICIRPMAPFGDLAHTSPALSTSMTARIPRTGTSKRREAFSTKSANGSLVAYLAVGSAGRVSATAAALLTVTATSKSTTARRLLPNKCKRAAVLAPVQSKAASRRLFGRPGPPLRATVAQSLVGTEEWCGTWPNRGMADRIPNARTITPPRSRREGHGQ